MIAETSKYSNICCGEEVISGIWTQDKGKFSIDMGICPECKSLFLNKINTLKAKVAKPVKVKVKSIVKKENKKTKK